MNKIGAIIKNIKNDRQGSTTILITMLILSGMLIVSLTASDLVQGSLRLGKSQINSAKAYFAAEAGAERALWEIRKNRIIHDGLIICDNINNIFCFDWFLDGNIANCNSSCLPPNFVDYQELSNSSAYSLKYEDPGGGDINIYSRGSYIDPRDPNNYLSRVIMVSY